MSIIFKCEICERSEHETPLFHYPIHVTYKELITLLEHRDKHAVICTDCLIKDIAEG